MFPNSSLTCKGTDKKYDLYIWGNAYADETSNYNLLHPFKIEKFYDIEGKDISSKFKEIKSIEFGKYFTAVINKEGELFIWIKPIMNCNPDRPVDEQTIQEYSDILVSPGNSRRGVLKISGKLKVKEVKFTQDKLFFTDTRGDLYMHNLVIGKVERSSYFVKGPDIPSEININSSIIKVKEIQNVKQIDTGHDHIMILNDKGEVYGMGDDSFGQLGLGTFTDERERQMKSYGNFIIRREKLPKKSLAQNIEKIACGDNHTIFLDKDSHVYGCGYNRYLQLSNDQSYRDKIIGLNKPTSISKMNSSLIVSDVVLNTNTVKRVVDVVCSGNCSFFVVKEESKGSEDGRQPKQLLNYEVYGCGEGLKGVLGINQIRHISDIELLPDISGLQNEKTHNPIEIQGLSCGSKHCLLLLKNPRMVFSWGDNEYGQLGTNSRVFTESPFPMLEEFTVPNKILKVFAGKHNSAFICESSSEEKVQELMKRDNDIYASQVKEKEVKKKEAKERRANVALDKGVEYSLETENKKVELRNKFYDLMGQFKKYL
eukprot:CAMPEP_0170526504 /NCGR_PEP_ID=MMETSP0209-20121228/11893_1 /TAXON_ID=665100 ORGANISM="Litonotus pictus, Strain P1" /NCGR_SAMPLE_ID=MMETSP0209 /ASSEMBLY_ACC=CAM_ASM_000301 /LENGTH=540 /DNA_ID=CAMNT_0010816349 /DNA_START=141 /DNA_END=1763 /DNA_ORIENTATION=+